MIASAADLSSEEIREIVNSQAFELFVDYNILHEKLEILQEDDNALSDAIISNIEKEHSKIESKEDVRQIISSLRKEISSFAGEGANQVQLTCENTGKYQGNTNQFENNDSENLIRNYLQARLEESEKLELKARDIAPEIDLSSQHVGKVLSKWKKHGGPTQWDITVSDESGMANTWLIRRNRE